METQVVVATVVSLVFLTFPVFSLAVYLFVFLLTLMTEHQNQLASSHWAESRRSQLPQESQFCSLIKFVG